jgi:hypothetical protein
VEKLARDKHSSLVQILINSGRKEFYNVDPRGGLYCKFITIVNDDSWVINKLEASLNYNARVIIYDRHMFIVQATD